MSFKAGYIGLIGLPNAGKSTLVNKLVGSKVGIVTAKPQTTRQKIVGIYTDDHGQFLFVDAPGIIKADKGLNKFLQEEAENVAKKSDVLIAVLNLDEQNPDQLESIIDWVEGQKKPWMAIIAKTDLGKDHRALILKEKLREKAVVTVTLSALKESADKLRERLLPSLLELLPESPAPLFDPDYFTTQNMRELSAEIVREKCFEYLHQEIPYGLAVKIDKYDEEDPTITKIYAQIIINKPNHKSMLIGQKGQSIKRIGSSARVDLESLIGTKVYLDLHVKVKPNWMGQENFLKELGYVCQE